jgi:hypothetical protein
MKKLLTYIVVFIVFASCSNNNTTEIPPNAQNEYDFLITKNLKLGKPTPEKLLPIKKDIRTYFKKLGKKSDDLLQWEERGPNNVGGRTRAIMFDPNDISHKKVFAGGVSGGLWYNNDITNVESSWVNIDDFWTSLGVTCITHDPNNTQVFYVGTGESSARSTRGGGLWKSTDGGVTWNNNPLVLTNDKGESETISEEAYYINDIMIRDNEGVSELYLASAQKNYMGEWHSENVGGLWKSTDGGANFIRIKLEADETISTTNIPYDLELASDNTVWAGTVGSVWEGGPKGGKVYKATDGITFSKVYDSEPVTEYVMQNRVELAIAPSNSNVAYVLIADNPENDGSIKMVKSIDGGTTWTNMPFPNDADGGIPAGDFTRGQSFYDLILKVKPDDENYLIAGGIDLFYSDNATNIPVEGEGDMSWTQMTHWYGGFSYPYSHADQHQIVFHPTDYNQVVFGSDGGISFSDDITARDENDRMLISDRNKDYNVTQFYAGDIYKAEGTENLIAGSQDNGSQYFTAAGVNSTVEVTGGDGAYCFLDDDSDIMITSYVYNNYYLLNKAGVEIKSFGTGNSGSFINPTDYDSKHDLLVSYANLGKINIYDISEPIIKASSKSVTGFTDQTLTHIKISPTRIEEDKPDIFIGTSEGNVIYMKKVYGLFGVETEDLTSDAFEGSVSSIDVGVSTEELLVTFSNYGVKSVWYTTDGGTTWLDKDSNLPDMPIRWGIFNKADRKNVLLATELGVWETKDITAETPLWNPVNEGLANVRVNMLKTTDYDNSVVAATYGRGLFTAKLEGEVLSLEKAQLAKEFNIYPNPVVNETLYLKSNTDITIASIQLYNISGQMVINKDFDNKVQAELDVSNLAKNQYILKVETDKGYFSKKIIIGE